MNATNFTREELSLIASACREMSHKRAEQFINADADSRREGWAQSNEKESKTYYAIAEKIGEHLKFQVDRIPDRE